MKLICTDNGWVDQSGKPYDKDKPVKCQKGCRALTEDDMKNATYERDEAPTNENLIVGILFFFFSNAIIAILVRSTGSKILDPTRMPI